MAVRYAAPSTMRWSMKVMVALAVIAALLVAAVPAALFVGLILTVFGHVIIGLALFGASILAAIAAVAIASLVGFRQLRKLVTEQGLRVVRLGSGDYSYR